MREKLDAIGVARGLLGPDATAPLLCATVEVRSADSAAAVRDEANCRNAIVVRPSAIK